MPRSLEPCGTRAAYERHRYNREPIDDACRAANVARTQAWRQACRELLKLPGMASEYAALIETFEMPQRSDKARREMARRHREVFRVLLDEELAALASPPPPEEG